MIENFYVLIFYFIKDEKRFNDLYKVPPELNFVWLTLEKFMFKRLDSTVFHIVDPVTFEEGEG